MNLTVSIFGKPQAASLVAPSLPIDLTRGPPPEEPEEIEAGGAFFFGKERCLEKMKPYQRVLRRLGDVFKPIPV